VSQSIALSEVDLTVLDAALSRMVKRSFGALTTLPLFCLGELESTDLPEVIHDHYEAWHSFLIVARETLHAAGMAGSPESAAITELLGIADTLRDAYLELADCRTLSTVKVRQAFERLFESYIRIPKCICIITESLDLEVSAISEPGRLTIASGYRSLARFAEALQAVTGCKWAMQDTAGVESSGSK
jgi:hypothetical protein